MSISGISDNEFVDKRQKSVQMKKRLAEIEA